VAVGRSLGSDGDDVVSRFFLIKYQSIVAKMREINLARQLFRVSLANRREMNVARHLFGISLFINYRPIKFPRSAGEMFRE
jgi:hypothetical protein